MDHDRYSSLWTNHIVFVLEIAEALFAQDAATLRSTELLDATYDPIVRPSETVNVQAGFSLFSIDSVVSMNG
ncbi:hypothetical protein CHS0354_009136 [Potamilus streckersoni]|uniref:Uncharacterized protein n=1 Tax=Potamilus streckersoni TaxID=2493646 RepID=A0AAE0W012_9BIVA|nr:hypothetical protein CHS0354_009136 [Potamilus streckersoni]